MCANCLISVQMLDNCTMDFDGDDEEVKEFTGSGIEPLIKMEIDRNSGIVSGWEYIWALL